MNHKQTGPIGLNDPNRRVFAGVWDTVNVASVVFDASEWFQAWPAGVLQILVQRPGDTIPYAAQNVSVSDGLAEWTFDEVDTAAAGIGSCALVFTVGEEIRARTTPYDLLIASTIGPEGADPPEPLERWYDDILNAAAAAENAEDTAAAWATGGDPPGTPSATNNAKYFAAQSAASAAEAAASAASIDPTEINRRILASYPHSTASGAVASISDGADGIPVRSVAVDLTGARTFAQVPNVFLNASGIPTLLNDAKQRTIVFPCAGDGLTIWTVANGLASAHMRIASFAVFPENGSVPSVFSSSDSGASVSVTPADGDKWIMAQMFTNDDADATPASAFGDGFGISPAPVWEIVRVHRSGKNLAPAATLSNYWGSGMNLQGGGYHTPLFRVQPGAKYTWHVKTARTEGPTRGVWFGSKMDRISGFVIPNDGSTQVTVTAPENAEWVSLSYFTIQEAFQFERGETATAITAHSEAAAMLDLSDGTLSAPLTTAEGNDDIFADAGEITVDYRADPTLYIARKIEEAGA